MFSFSLYFSIISVYFSFSHFNTSTWTYFISASHQGNITNFY